MSINFRFSTWNGKKIKAYSFHDVFDAECETISCPDCESCHDKVSLESKCQEDIFGGAHMTEVVHCIVCDCTFEVLQHFTSDVWSAMPPF